MILFAHVYYIKKHAYYADRRIAIKNTSSVGGNKKSRVLATQLEKVIKTPNVIVYESKKRTKNRFAGM